VKNFLALVLSFGLVSGLTLGLVGCNQSTTKKSEVKKEETKADGTKKEETKKEETKPAPK